MSGAIDRRLRGLQRALAVMIIAIVLYSVVSVSPKPLAAQPFPDAQEVADATHRMVRGGGYVTYVHDNQPKRPRYSPGFSVFLAPFAAIGDDYPANVQRGATFYAAVYVLLVAIAAWSLAGPAAASLAAVLIGVSPFARAEAALIMSDGLAAALTVLLIPLLHRPTPRKIIWAGLLAGVLVAVRMPSALALISLFIVLPWGLRKILALSAAPPLAALGLFNWLTFGSPLKTGYDYWYPGAHFFGPEFALRYQVMRDGPWVVGDALDGRLLSWTCPCPLGGPQNDMINVAFYAAVLAGLFWSFVPPLVPVVGAVYAWQHRREPAVRFTFWFTILSLLLFTFYFYQATRFMAAPVTLLGVLASAKVGEWIEGRHRVHLPAAS